MKRIFLPFALFLALFPSFLFADSPLTSTDFWTAYQDVEIVQYAHENKVLDAKVLKYLKKKRNPIAVKAAIVNALSWNFDGTDFAQTYSTFLAKRYKTSAANLNLDKLRGDELMVLGYLTALGDYFHPGNAVPILQKAQAKMPKSFTVNMILALTEAQVAFDSDWCKVYQLPQAVVEHSALKQDMNETAIEVIMEYMRLYRADCE